VITPLLVVTTTTGGDTTTTGGIPNGTDKSNGTSTGGTIGTVYHMTNIQDV